MAVAVLTARAPSSGTATGTTPASIQVTLTKTNGAEFLYQIWRKQRSQLATSFTLIKTVAPNDPLACVDSGLEPATIYDYRSRAIHPTSGKFGQYSAIFSGTTLNAPSDPTGLALTVQGVGDILAEWTDTNSGNAEHLVEWSTDQAAWDSFTTAPGAVSYGISGLTPATLYFVRVSAVWDGVPSTGYSTDSDTTASEGGSPPGTPTGLSATAVSHTRINLAWTLADATNTSTEIERSPNGTTGWAQIATVGSDIEVYANTGLTPSTAYHYRVRAVNTNGNSAYSNVATDTTPAAPSGSDPILLDSATMTALQAKRTGNTAQFQSFKARLDANLAVNVHLNSYQGSALPYGMDYALGYRLYKDADATQAAKYADKAIAIVKTGLRSYLKTGWECRQFLARGTGAQTQYTLPIAGVIASSLKVYLGTVTTVAVTHGAQNGQDVIAAFRKVIKVSNTSDGTVDYAETTDWRQNPDYANERLDWSSGGSEPTSRNLTGCSTVSGQTTLTCATGNFTGADVGLGVSAAPQYSYYINTNTTIAEVLSSTQVRLSQAAPYTIPSFDASVGQIYYVTSTGMDSASQTFAFSRVGDVITMNAAPSTAQAVLVDYVANDPAVDTGHVNLWYQQTSNGLGGFNNSLVDFGYATRYMGFVALTLNWLSGYANLDPALEAEAQDLMVRWSDGYLANGFLPQCPVSNYGIGGYLMRVFNALYLTDSGHAEAARLLGEVTTYRTERLIANLTGAGSLEGGWWAEGWNYGYGSTRNLVLSGLALESKAVVAEATEERTWAGELIESWLTGQPTASTIYNGGDWYDYPAPFPVGGVKTPIYIAASATLDSTLASYANYMIQNYSGSHSADTYDLIYRDPSASAAFWTAYPLHYLNEGPGLLHARADWNYNSTWFSFLCGNEQGDAVSASEHQLRRPAQLQIQRGADALLENTDAISGNQDITSKARTSNALILDDNKAGEMISRWGPGFYYGPRYGTAGVFMHIVEGNAARVYASGDYIGSYRQVYTGALPGTELTRAILYVRPDYIFVYDRATTDQAAWPKHLTWHTKETTAVITAGTFTLTFNGETTSSLAFNATAAQVQTALRALSTIGATGCTVTAVGRPSSLTPSYWQVNLTGALAGTAAPLITGSASITPGGGVGAFDLTGLFTAGTNQVQEIFLYATVASDTWTVSVGSSKLFAKTFSSEAMLSRHYLTHIDGYGSGRRFDTFNTGDTARVCYVTGFQTAPSATGAMEATAHITSTGSKFEGILLGNVLALFGRTSTGAVSGTNPTGYTQSTAGGVSYSFTGTGATITHYIVDLVPNQVYTLSGDASGTPTASAKGVVTFTTTGSGAKTVTIT